MQGYGMHYRKPAEIVNLYRTYIFAICVHESVLYSITEQAPNTAVK